MVSSKKKRFQRELGDRPYLKLFVISVEGSRTEPLYFNIFKKNENFLIRLRCLDGTSGSDPSKVLRRIKEYLKNNRLKSSDEAWVVVDKDQWSKEQLDLLHKWSLSRPNYGFSLTNPMFEFWILLHFEDGNGIGSPQILLERLRRHIPNYQKEINPDQFSPEMINLAIERAKKKDNPPCKGWPCTPFTTTVYRLVEKMTQSRH